MLRWEKREVFLAFVVFERGASREEGVKCMGWNAKGILDEVDEAV